LIPDNLRLKARSSHILGHASEKKRSLINKVKQGLFLTHGAFAMGLYVIPFNHVGFN
jgi:hypothetical protein